LLNESFAFLADGAEPLDVESVLLADRSGSLGDGAAFGVCGSAVLADCAALLARISDDPPCRAPCRGPATVVRVLTDAGGLRATGCPAG